MSDYTPDSLRALFDRLRHDPAHHLGMGDIRLTMGQQDEIADAWGADLRRLAEFSSENATLRADNTALRERLEEEREVSEDAISEWKEMEPDLRKRLAEAQADNAALRDAAQDMLDATVNGLVTIGHQKRLAAALASQEDTDAQA